MRLLHGQTDQIIVTRIHRPRAIRRQLAGRLLRIDLDQPFPAFDWHAHPRTFLVDELDFGRQANELDVVPGERELSAQERTVRGAQNENVVCGFCHWEMCPSVEQKS